jgi:hypothetical protein
MDRDFFQLHVSIVVSFDKATYKRILSTRLQVTRCHYPEIRSTYERSSVMSTLVTQIVTVQQYKLSLYEKQLRSQKCQKWSKVSRQGRKPYTGQYKLRMQLMSCVGLIHQAYIND